MTVDAGLANLTIEKQTVMLKMDNYFFSVACKSEALRDRVYETLRGVESPKDFEAALHTSTKD